MNKWHRLDSFVARLERYLIVMLLSAMILVAFFQIVLRNFFATGLSWGDPFVRYLVVWVGFVGAALATKEGKHITIEVVSHWLSDSTKRYVRAFSHLFSAVICGLLTVAALKFIRFEALMGGQPIFGLPAWTPQVIIPITFSIMTFRFALHFHVELSIILKSGVDQKHKVEQ
jgi:TRAP-type C4-dicarboxylate transport system permease small subunit